MTAPASCANEPDNDDYSAARAELVREIQMDVRNTRGYLGKDELDPRVIDAMGKVPRHLFVPEELRFMAYENRPLPIGYEQTISQPYIVAIMTDLVGACWGDEQSGRVLEVGTGSGYQAAVLGELCEEVYSIEIVEPLGRATQALLRNLGYSNVHVKIGDGYAGWPEYAPFDGIVVTAAAPEIPQPLIDQLKPGGKMIIPVDARFGAQELVLLRKDEDGKLSRENVLPVRFVPLTGGRAGRE